MRTTPSPSEMFAAEVQYWRLDPEVWRTVLERCCEAGLPGISSYVPWEVHEIEPGRFDFDGSTDPRKNLVRYLDLVKELGLKLAYRPGPFVCNEMDWGGHPRRIVTGDHDYYVLQSDGERAQGYHIARKEGWQPSYLHPAYLDEVRIWLEAADGVARDYTVAAGGPIHMCNLDNELSYIVRDSMFGSDYNDVVVGEGGWYRTWLAAKYESVERLPYSGSHESWNDVAPPREIGDDLEKNLLWYFDWIACKEDLLSTYLKRLRSMHGDAGLAGVHYYTNLNPHRPEGIPTSFKKYADATGGLVGYDFYRNPWLKYSGYSSLVRVLKVMRATLPVIWSAEFMGGWWMTEMEKRIPQSHTEFMSLSAMAHGCQAISWFMFHDRDNWGDAPVSELGHKRENHAALAEVNGVVEAVPQWDAMSPVSDLAVAYYRPYMWHCHLGDESPCNDGELHVGQPSLWGADAGASVREYEGLFRLVEQAGYTAGCVDLSDAPERLGDYKLLWLAAEPFIETATAKLLERFVTDGGVLVLGQAWPDRTPSGESCDLLSDARPTSDVDDAFVVREHGKGRVVWCPRPVASCEPGAEDVATVSAVRSLLEKLIGRPAVAATTDVVRWRTWKDGGGADWKEEPHNLVDAILHEGDGTRVLFIVNVHERAVRVTVSFRDVTTGRLGQLGGDGLCVDIVDGTVEIAVDRKSTVVFRLIE